MTDLTTAQMSAIGREILDQFSEEHAPDTYQVPTQRMANLVHVPLMHRSTVHPPSPPVPRRVARGGTSRCMAASTPGRDLFVARPMRRAARPAERVRLRRSRGPDGPPLSG